MKKNPIDDDDAVSPAKSRDTVNLPPPTYHEDLRYSNLCILFAMRTYSGTRADLCLFGHHQVHQALPNVDDAVCEKKPYVYRSKDID